MFSGKKDDKSKRPRRTGGLAQLGLMDVPTVDNLGVGGGDSDDDADLEAELLALTGGGGGRKGPKKGKPIVSPEELSKMVSECMRDDDNVAVGDDVSDEDDADLLAELSALGPADDDDDDDDVMESTPIAPTRPAPSVPSRPSPVSDYRNPEPMTPRHTPMAGGSNLMMLLAERVSMYEQAEVNAKASGETSRARRFNRGLKTLQQMQKTMKAGRPIDEEDIPPAVVVKNNGDSTEGSADTSSTCSPAALSPAGDQAPPPVPPHRDSVGNLPTSIPHNVVFKEAVNVDPAPQHVPRAPIDNGSIPSERPLARTNSTSSGPPPQRLDSSDPASILRHLHTQYKMAALAAKKDGDKEQAINCMRTMKQLEPMLRAAENGQPIDLTTVPSPPGSAIKQPPPWEKKPELMITTPGPPNNIPVESTVAAGNGEAPPGGPATVMEALEQRLAKYTEQRDKARNEENSRKERQNQRIMKQYEDAIKKHKAGKPVEFEELPSPPGFPPIPVGSSKPAGGPPVASDQNSTNEPPREANPPAAAGSQAPAVPARKPAPAKPNVRQAPQSRVEKQLAFLTKRQGQFRQAALEAKKRGEVEQAKEYLRMSKGFDQLIEATKGGLPVDMNTVPVPPQEQVTEMNTDFELVSADDCVMAPSDASADTTVTYAKLEEDLVAQIKMCAQTREHFKATGDVASANRFEQLILHTKKDLDSIRAAFKRGDAPPRFHYESRSFNIIQCNTDLNDSDCEVTVLRGINFNVQNPKDVDTLVKIEFPYPSDNPPQDRSNVVKDTNNPEYNHKIVFSIDRKSRALARCFKRHAIKLQVIAKGGWFHRDTLIGVVKVPLVTLETKCTLHESYDLADERKKMVGGKIEVKVRVRNPIVTKQLEKVTEKWLVIDGF